MDPAGLRGQLCATAEDGLHRSLPGAQARPRRRHRRDALRRPDRSGPSGQGALTSAALKFQPSAIVEGAQRTAERRQRGVASCASSLLTGVAARPGRRDRLPADLPALPDGGHPVGSARGRLAVGPVARGRPVVGMASSTGGPRSGPVRPVPAGEPAQGFEITEALARLAEDAGIPLIHLALAFVRQHPAVTAPICRPQEYSWSTWPPTSGRSEVTLAADVRSTGSTRSLPRARTSAGRTSGWCPRRSRPRRCAGRRKRGGRRDPASGPGEAFQDQRRLTRAASAFLFPLVAFITAPTRGPAAATLPARLAIVLFIPNDHR